MTHEVNSRPLPPAASPAPAAAASPSAMDRVDRGLEWLWHFISSMRVAMVIMLGIALLGVAGSLLVQAPQAVLDDPAAKAEWLESVRPKYGGWTNILDTVGLFQVFNSIIFRILVAALTISLIACSIHRIPGMIHTARNPRIDVGPAFFEHAPQHEAIVVRRSPEETRVAVEGVLRARRYRTLTSDDGTVHIYADRFRLAPFAGLVGHLSLVVIMAGAIIGGMFGYRDSQFTLAEGQTLPVAAEAGVTIQLLDFTDRYDTTTGAPIDYASQVVLYKSGVEVDRHTVRVNDPLRYNGLTFYQAFFGAAATMSVKDAEGNALLTSSGVPLAWTTNDEGRHIGSFSIPGTPYVGWVTGTLGTGDTFIAPGQVRVELYTTGEGSLVDSKVIDQGKPATIGNLTMTFERESQFTGLNIARDPGVPLIWIGSFLLFVGFVIRFTVPHKRIWGRIVSRPNGGAVVGMATLTPKDVTAGSEFENVVNDIRTALAAPAQA
jgi:cytochrome c biogenesis protein